MRSGHVRGALNSLLQLNMTTPRCSISLLMALTVAARISCRVSRAVSLFSRRRADFITACLVSLGMTPLQSLQSPLHILHLSFILLKPSNLPSEIVQLYLKFPNMRGHNLNIIVGIPRASSPENTTNNVRCPPYCFR